MGIPSASASLTAVREDLDLPTAGTITERAVLNKVNKQVPPVSLAAFRGNILGTQLYLTKAYQGQVWQKKKDQTSEHFYITATEGLSIKGNRIALAATGQGASGDSGMEARIVGTVAESGRYRLSGNTDCNYGRVGNEMHHYLITNTLGYLNGVNNVVLQKEHTEAFGKGEKSWSYDVDLATDHPYVTFVIRNVHKSGNYGDTSVFEFWDWKLEKI